MIHSATRLLKSGVRLALGKLGYGLVKLPKDESTNLATRKIEPAPAEVPRTEPLVRTISDFSTSPVDLYVRKHYEMFRTGHFDCTYPEWRVRRIRKVIDLYGTDFKGKRITELGGGLGDIGAFFAELGADVLSVEGRKENVDLANIKYHHLPTFKSVQRDLEKDFSDLGRFDFVISFGSIEVLSEIDQYIGCCCELSDSVFCETSVIKSDDPRAIKPDYPRGKRSNTKQILNVHLPTNDHSMSGVIRSASPAYIERVFEERGFGGMPFLDPDLNYGNNVYDWVIGDDTGAKTTRRFWLFKRR